MRLALTEAEIDTLEAGPVLDALVAEKVFGLSLCEFRVTSEINGVQVIACKHSNGDGSSLAGYPSKCYEPGLALHHYSRNIAPAWEVVEKVNAETFTVGYYKPGEWEVDILLSGLPEIPEGKETQEFVEECFTQNPGRYLWHYVVASTAPLAICRAALKCVALEAGL